MALIDVVKYDANQDEFVWKFPSNDLRIGTQLVVKTSQMAIFVKNGEILDVFSEGRYTLNTGNIPLLNKLINIPFGGDSPFQAEVWFINLLSKLNNKWGTVTPLQIEDPKYNIIVPVRAFGQFGFKIVNGELFLKEIVGTMKSFSSHDIIDYFKGKLLSSLNSSIGKKMLLEGYSVLQLSVVLDELGESCKNAIKDQFSMFGIEILTFDFISINIPEGDPSLEKLKRAKDLASSANIAGAELYKAERTLDALNTAAANEGMAGTTLGASLGAGLGFAVGNNILPSNNSIQNSQPNSAPPVPSISQYHVVIDGSQVGPYDLQSLKNLISSGKMNRTTLVWQQGMENWAMADTRNDLMSFFGSMPPPLPT